MCIPLNDLKELLEKRCLQKFTDDEFSSMTSFFHDSGLILLPGTFLPICISHFAHSHAHRSLCPWMLKKNVRVIRALSALPLSTKRS